jgi:hypothetical protein
LILQFVHQSIALNCASMMEARMKLAKRIGGLAIVAVIAAALTVPTTAEARGGRFAAGAFAGFAADALIGTAIGGAWGPYPYYYGYPGPVYFPPVPYYGPMPITALAAAMFAPCGPVGTGVTHASAITE